MRTTTTSLIAVAALALPAAPALAEPQTTVTETPGIAIPDNAPGGVTATISVGSDPDGMNIIEDLDVGVIIEHTWQGDLVIDLTSPMGTTVRLMDRPGQPGIGAFGFSADNLGDPSALAGVDGAEFIFDDEATETYDDPQIGAPGIDSPTGNWQPDTDLLSAFDGESRVGDWLLTVIDSATGDTGTIDQVSLYFTNAAVPAPGALALLGLGGLAGRRRRRR